MSEDYQDTLSEFGQELVDLIDKYRDRLPPYEIVYRLIADGVSISLCTAPNELVGMKTAYASMQGGIEEYEKTHS